VIEQNAHPQLNKAIIRAAELESKMGNYVESVGFYRMHASKNPEVESQLNAYNNIFKAYYAAKLLDSVGKVITEIQALSLYSKEEQAKMSRGLAEAYSDSTSLGLRTEWLNKTIALDPKGDIGAEAQYQLAVQLSKEGKIKESNDMITSKFKNEFAEASDSVMGRAYILLATNFVSLKNLPQAKAILKSVIDNSTDNEVIEIAKTTLKSLPLK
jgi:predicted negative regulator of RcsB-dependent stress response